MTNPAAHTAQGDAFVTAEAARVLLARYADQRDVEKLPTSLDKLLVPFDPSPPDTNARRRPDDEERTLPQLTAEHLEAHGADLRDGRSRRKVLDVCLTERCGQPASRMEDGIVSPAGARQVVEWALALLETGDLDRRMTGRVLAGLGRALRRCEKPSYAEQVLLTQLGPLLLQWGACSSTQCGRCLHSAGTCRFTEAGRHAVEAFVYDSSAYPQVRKAAADVGESRSILRRLERRRERLNVQLAASPRSQVENPWNLRPARPSSPGMAPLQGGSQSKS